MAVMSSGPHLLDQDLSPPVSHAMVRASICSASHPNPFSGRRETEAIYLTVNDGRTIGNARCAKPGPTQAHCDICWHVFGVLQRETALHVASECPYSRLVIDPVLREVAFMKRSFILEKPGEFMKCAPRFRKQGSNVKAWSSFKIQHAFQDAPFRFRLHSDVSFDTLRSLQK